MNKLQQDIKNNKPIIIFADSDYFPLLMKYKDKTANIKFMSCHQAVSIVSFEITEAMIAALIKKGVEYTKAKQILNNLQLLGDKRIEDAPESLKKYYEVIKPLIVDHGYDASHIFKNKSLYLFNATADVQFAKLFESKGFKVEHLSIEQLGINDKFDQVDEVINFDNKIEQYFYVFADIRKQLLLDPENANKIRLLVKDTYDVFYLNLFSKLFNVDLYINLVQPLYNQPTVIEAIKGFYNKGCIKADDIKVKDPASLELKKIIQTYGLENLDFKQGYLNLLEIAISTTYDDPYVIDKGIVATNELRFGDYKTYVLSFEDGIFYTFYKDNDVITDLDKVKLSINPSYVRTILDKQKKLSYIKFNNIVHLSRVKQHLDEHIYESGLIDILNIKQRLFDYGNEKDIAVLTKLSFTQTAANMLAAILGDKRYDVSRYRGKINSYNNQPDAIKVNPPKKYSVSAIQKYSECPFKYLLDTYAGLSSLDDRYFMELGTLLHKVLEHIADKEFDYDKLFDDAAETFKDTIKTWANGVYDKKYDAYLTITKKWFRYIAIQYRNRLLSLPNPIKLLNEVKFDFKINNYDFTGRIDALMLSQNDNNKFYTVIDYKTGSTEFEPLGVCVGQNIQLPMYAYALAQSNQKHLVNGYSLGGFGIKHILGNTPRKYRNKKDEFNLSSLLQYCEANLCHIDDEDQEYEKSLTEWELTGKGTAKTTDHDQIVKLGKLDTKTGGITFVIDIDTLCKQARDVVISTIKQMEDNNFPVRVTANAGNIMAKPFEIKKDDTNCRYCKHCDICYRKITDYYEQSAKVLSAWKVGE